MITNAVLPPSKRNAREMADRTGDLKLHLRAGPEYRDGWVNIDVVGYHEDLLWDLRHGIPFPDESVDAVFSEHMLEHLVLPHGDTLIAECHRAFRPGGDPAGVVPDAGAFARSYTDDGEFLEVNRPGRPTRMLAMQEIFYWYRHAMMYDEETLGLLLRATGSPTHSASNTASPPWIPAPDTARRKPESLYIEAVR